MAKTSAIQRNLKRIKMAKRFDNKRKKLKAIVRNKKLPLNERFAAQLKLSELPKNSSEEFGDGIVKEVLPYILGDDDGRINKATIIKDGEFLPFYNYLKDYINSK